MRFIVLGYDGNDDKAEERRFAVRKDHLKLAQELTSKGRWLYGCAILGENKKMIGSMIVCDFPDRQTLYKEWLDREAYILGGVWEDLKVNQAEVPPFLEK